MKTDLLIKAGTHQFLSTIKIVRTNVDRHNRVGFEIKHCAQIRFDLSRVNRPAVTSGESVDFVRAQPTVEWIFFENLQSPTSRLFLTGVSA
jgi:hypothetical protein